MARDGDRQRDEGEERRGRPDAGGGGQGEPAGGSEPDRIEVEIAAVEVVAILARLDLEAALASEAAAEQATDPELEAHLHELARDHRAHLEALNEALEAEGESPVAVAPAAGAGPVLEGVVRLTGPLGDEVLVVSVMGHEQLTSLSYDAALAYEWDAETEAMLRRFQRDEERHMSWLAAKHEALGGRAEHPDAPY